MLFDDFIQVVEKTILKVDDIKKQQLKKYHDDLIEYNKKVNLISRNETDVYDRHFLNSILILKFISFPDGSKILDIGSGGGFPGLVLAILFPQSEFTLVESILKKIIFLQSVKTGLALKNVQIVHDRVEKLSSSYRKKFHFVTARALAPLEKLIELSKPFLSPDGKMLFWKGRTFQDEISNLDPVLSKRLHIEVFPFQNLTIPQKPHDGALLSIKNFP